MLIFGLIPVGVSFSGTWGLLKILGGGFQSDTGPAIDFGSTTFLSVLITGLSVTLISPTAVAFAGVSGSGNILANGLGKITDCLIDDIGGGTLLTGLDDKDFRWRFNNSALIPDTRQDALMYVNGNATETAIATQSVAVKVAATFTQDRTSHFSFDSSGKFTFIGEIATTLPIDIAVSASVPSGTHDVKFYIALNGAALVQTQTFTTLSSTGTASVSPIWQHTFVPGDFIEVFVSNESSTTNVIVSDCVIRIN